MVICALVSSIYHLKPKKVCRTIRPNIGIISSIQLLRLYLRFLWLNSLMSSEFTEYLMLDSHFAASESSDDCSGDGTVLAHSHNYFAL